MPPITMGCCWPHVLIVHPGNVCSFISESFELQTAKMAKLCFATFVCSLVLTMFCINWYMMQLYAQSWFCRTEWNLQLVLVLHLCIVVDADYILLPVYAPIWPSVNVIEHVERTVESCFTGSAIVCNCLLVWWCYDNTVISNMSHCEVQ